jgi:ribosomal protein L31E
MFEAFEHLNFGFVSDSDIRISNLLTPLKRLARRAYEVRTSRAGRLMRLIKGFIGTHMNERDLF